MRLRLRLLLTLIRAIFGKRLDLFDTSRLAMVVLPNDIDVRVVSNDRYHAFMDLGRIDLLIRFGLMRTFIRKQYVPIVRLMSIRYTYPVRLFQRFHLESRVLCWDSEWVWFEQKFVRQGRSFAVAYCKGCAHGRNGRVLTAELLKAIGQSDRPSPPPGDLIMRLEEIEAAYRASS
jgi:acyl-CoA thioesterase FadM